MKVKRFRLVGSSDYLQSLSRLGFKIMNRQEAIFSTYKSIGSDERTVLSDILISMDWPEFKAIAKDISEQYVGLRKNEFTLAALVAEKYLFEKTNQVICVTYLPKKK